MGDSSFFADELPGEVHFPCYKLKLAHTCRIRSSKVLLFKIRAKLLCEEFYKC